MLEYLLYGALALAAIVVVFLIVVAMQPADFQITAVRHIRVADDFPAVQNQPRRADGRVLQKWRQTGANLILVKRNMIEFVIFADKTRENVRIRRRCRRRRCR